MTEYYVKTGGDNAKDGLSWANAWATIEYAQANAASGIGNTKTPTEITTQKNIAINTKGSLKWFYLDDDSGGGGSWHGWFNVIHIDAGLYNEIAAFVFNPPEWTRWEGAAFDTTKLFEMSYNSDHVMSNDYVVIHKCSMGGAMYDPTFSLQNYNFAMIDCGLRGAWITTINKTADQLYWDGCYYPGGVDWCIVQLDYVIDSTFKDLSPHVNATMAILDVHGDRNLFDNIAGITATNRTSMKISGNDNIITGCSDIKEIDTCGTSSFDIQNSTIDFVEVRRSAINKISDAGNFTDLPYQMCHANGSLWMDNHRDYKCYEFNPNTSAVSKSWAAPHESHGLAWDGSNLWMTSYWTDLCYEKDTAGNPISQFALVDMNPLTWVAGYLYTADANNFYKYDTLGNLIDTYPVTASSIAIAYDGTYIWGLQNASSSVINKFSVTGELLETVTTGVSKPDGDYTGIAADTLGNIWIVANCSGSTTPIYLVLSGSQLCVDCVVDKFTTQQDTQLTLDWNARDFYETSNSQWTTVTTAKSQLVFAGGLTNITLTNRPLLITTSADVSALITLWETVSTFMDKTFKIDASGSRTLTFQLGDMRPATMYKIYAGAVRLPDAASDGSGVLTFSYTGSFSEIEFDLSGYVPTTCHHPRKSTYLGPANTFGWLAGGLNTLSNESKVVDRITLAEDTTNAVYRCDLNVARFSLAGFDDNTYGWFGGGNAFGPNLDVVDRITIADDTTNALDRCNLSSARYGLAAFTNSTYGWFGGGGNPDTDLVDRIELATDNVDAIPRCTLSLVRDNLAAFADATYGWFGGGSASGTETDLLERITLADDTTNAIPRCILTVERHALACFTDNTYGWFGGGNDPLLTSDVVDRITLADDTTNAIDRCSLVSVKSYHSAFTDNTYGWFSGGHGNYRVERMTLATDTVNAIDRCDMSEDRRGLAAISYS